MRFGTKLSLAIVLAALMGSTFTVNHASTQAQVEEASYVRVCKDRRGQPDRRACHGKEDPKRTVLAFNLPQEFAR